MRAFLLGLIALACCVSAGALDQGQRLSQYAHAAWRIQDGFFSGAPQAITQTADGYLWIGTEGGLVRFDGMRFVRWTPPDGKQLPSVRIHSLLGARDGSLWIGTSRGLAKWDNSALANVEGESAFIESIIEDPEGNIWVTRSQVHDDSGPLCEVHGNGLHCLGRAEGIPFVYAQPLFRDTQGSLWLGSSTGLCRWKPGDAKAYLTEDLRRNNLLAGVSAIESGPDGSVLVGIKSGKGFGLQQLREGRWKPYVLPGFNKGEATVTALLRDRAGGLWIGTQNQGIYRVRGGEADHFDNADGLSSDSVQGFYEDREGNLWVATSRGIDRFHETRVASFSMREGLTSEDVDSVLAARDGTIWIGNVEALNFLRDGKVSAIREGDGLPGRLITSLFEDHQGRLWVGVDDGLLVYERGRFQAVTTADGKPLGVVTAITEDVAHSIWAAVTKPALFRIQDLKVRDELTPPGIPRVMSLAADSSDGIWLGFSSGALGRYSQGKLQIMPTTHPVNHAVRSLLAEADGSVWESTQDGAFLWREGKERILNSQNGLPCDEVYTVLKDNRGSLWLDTQCGFVVIDGPELSRWWQEPNVAPRVNTFDVFDGAQPGLTNFRPEASKSPDGKLWFANENILQVIDPEHLAGNSVPPPVHVERIVADHKTYLPGGNVRLPAHTRDIEIDYTALSLVAPEKVRFRYKLENHDSDWQDPQNRRQAFYTDLIPGNYRFHVVAANNDNVWNDAGAELELVVSPAFYQTAWFRLACLVVFVGVLWLVYMLRLRNLAARIQARFEERLEERERIARNLHDTLLQGIYSASIHFELANNRLPEDSPAKRVTQRGLELLGEVSRGGRDALRTLRSREPEIDDLEQALSRLRKEFALPETTEFRVTAQGEPRLLTPLIRDEAYLIVREAVVNAIRHSHADQIAVEVDYSSRTLLVSVRDNGCGIDDQILKTGREGHWGLAGMRERAERIGATLEVLSRVNSGTEIQLSISGKTAYRPTPNGGRWSWLARFFPGKRQGDKVE